MNTLLENIKKESKANKNGCFYIDFKTFNKITEIWKKNGMRYTAERIGDINDEVRKDYCELHIKEGCMFCGCILIHRYQDIAASGIIYDENTKEAITIKAWAYEYETDRKLSLKFLKDWRDDYEIIKHTNMKH